MRTAGSRTGHLVLVVTATVLATTACGSLAGSRHSSIPERPRRASVSVSGYAYHPVTLTVAPGSAIVFINHDQTPHTATTTTVGFDTGTIDPGKAATVHVPAAGRYTYYCQFHAFMRATIVVR